MQTGDYGELYEKDKPLSTVNVGMAQYASL